MLLIVGGNLFCRLRNNNWRGLPTVDSVDLKPSISEKYPRDLTLT